MNDIETTIRRKRLVQDVVEETIKSLGFDWIRIVHEPDEQEVDDWNADSSSDYIRRVDAKIFGISEGGEDDEEEERRVEIGHISGCLMIFSRALNEGVDLLDQADSIDGDTEATASVLGDFYNSDEKVTFGGTGLEVREVFLKPAYRGRGLASILLRRYIDWYVSDLFAVVTYPNADHFFHREDGESRIHRSVEENDPLLDANTEAGNEKLRAWCKSLGFEESAKYRGYFVLDIARHDSLWRRRKIARKGRINRGGNQ